MSEIQGLFYRISNEAQRKILIDYINALDISVGFECQFAETQEKKRTISQNSALHKFCELLADALNSAGYDMKRVVKQEIDIPWSKSTVKEFLWRPIQVAMTNKKSTTEASTAEYSQVHATLMRHISQKFGVYVEWPSSR